VSLSWWLGKAEPGRGASGVAGARRLERRGDGQWSLGSGGALAAGQAERVLAGVCAGERGRGLAHGSAGAVGGWCCTGVVFGAGRVGRRGGS
jgi:hypothetical protein